MPHKGIKNHVCSICGKAFAGKKHMQRHEKIHQEFKALACDLCDYRSHRRDKLREHIRKHHPHDGVIRGLVTAAEVEREKNCPKKRHKAKKKKNGDRHCPRPEGKVAEGKGAEMPADEQSVSVKYVEYGVPTMSQPQGGIVAATLPQPLPQLLHAAHLPGTTTISDEMMHYFTSVSAPLPQQPTVEQRAGAEVVSVSNGGTVTSPTATPLQSALAPPARETVSAIPVTQQIGDQSFLLYCVASQAAAPQNFS